MIAKLRVLALAALCLEACGDVVVDPSASRMWSTVTESQVVLPLPWPAGAATATLSVPASGLFAGTEAILSKSADASYVLELPRPSSPGEEYMEPALKAAGLLTRDPRMKERKKYGLKAARRAPQFSKR